MKDKLGIGIKMEWVERPANCQPCSSCMEPIYGKRYVAEITVGDSVTETKIEICESCYIKVQESSL